MLLFGLSGLGLARESWVVKSGGHFRSRIREAWEAPGGGSRGALLSKLSLVTVAVLVG